MNRNSDHKVPLFFEGAGEMGELILSFDWHSSTIGPISNWPKSLQTTLGNILHSAFPMFLFWGKDLTCFYNDAYRPILGANGKHPAIGQKGKEVWSEVWDKIGPLIDQVMTTGKPVWFEDSAFTIFRNGRMEEGYWTFSYSPAYTDAGEIGGVMVIVMETTQTVRARKQVDEVVAQRTRDLKEAHESLLNANAYLQQLINVSKEPIQVLEPVFDNNEIIDFKFRLTNQAYAAYANTTADKLQGRRVGEVFPGYFKTSSFTNVVKAYHSGLPDTWEIHYDLDGLDLYNKMSAVKMDDEVVVLFTDFSELKHLQLQLQNKITELERSNQNLEDFAHAASHDLQEPIRKINFFTAQLKRNLAAHLTEADNNTFVRIERAVERMENLINDLLSYSSMSVALSEKEPIDLNKSLQKVVEDLELTIQEKHATIQADSLPTVMGYGVQLQQLFQNLISNALKYSKVDVAPVIQISATTSEIEGKPYHQITLKDNGIGFEQEFAEKIFQMFTRLHGKGAYSGTGIGLSIARKVMDLHNGVIKAEGSPGQGASFKLYLPKEQLA